MARFESGEVFAGVDWARVEDVTGVALALRPLSDELFDDQEPMDELILRRAFPERFARRNLRTTQRWRWHLVAVLVRRRHFARQGEAHRPQGDPAVRAVEAGLSEELLAYAHDHAREIAARVRRTLALYRQAKPRTIEREMPGFWSLVVHEMHPWQRDILAVLRSRCRWRVDEAGWPTRDGAVPEEDA